MRRARDSGFTILEVMVAAAILALGLMGLLSAISSGLKLEENSRETQLALATARSKFDEMKADYASGDANFYTTYANQALYMFDDKNSNGVYDAGEESYPFQSGKTVHGHVTFLGEHDAAAVWGQPNNSIDLNGDGNTNDSPPGNPNFKTWVVKIDLSWRGATGNRSLVLFDTVFESSN